MVMTPDGHLSIANALLAFREIPKSHTGQNMANIIYDILREDGILHKVSGSISAQSSVLKFHSARHDYVR
jgi:hypothetical protein